MAVRSGFFNAVDDDRIYDASNFAEYFATFIGNGVFPTPSNGLQVYANDNMTTVVKAGKGWINGYFVANDSEFIIAHDRADGVLKRIDRIVLRKSVADRDIQIVLKKGTFATNPDAPAVVRDADFYELAIADVLINNGATQITQANITDQRLNKTVCGIVHGTVDQVDTTTIFNQYQAWFKDTTGSTAAEIKDWQSQQKQEFDLWFESIKDILSGDVAANLAARIASLEQIVDTHLDDSVKHNNYGIATGTNIISVRLPNGPSILLEGFTLRFKKDTTNTGAVSLRVNESAIIGLTKNGGALLRAGELKAGGIYTVCYDGRSFVLQGESEVEIGKQIITPNTVNQTITKGVHDGTGYVQGSPNLLPQYIKKGVGMFGVTGTYEGDLNSMEAHYLNPVTTGVPEAKPFYTIPMTGGWRIAQFMPNAGPGSPNRDYMNGGGYPTMQYRGISKGPGFGSNGTLYITVRSTDGRSWTYAFPKGYRLWFPWFSVILSGTFLYLRAYFEYDGTVVGGVYNDDANAVNISTTLAYDVKDISSIEFRVEWEYEGVTDTYTQVQGTVYKYK